MLNIMIIIIILMMISVIVIVTILLLLLIIIMINIIMIIIQALGRSSGAGRRDAAGFLPKVGILKRAVLKPLGNRDQGFQGYRLSILRIRYLASRRLFVLLLVV